jgi:hypothetical protein
MLPSNMLLLDLIPLIDVTFSTPTGVYTHNPEVLKENGGAWTAMAALPST